MLVRIADGTAVMPYVQRNTEGRVVSLSDECDEACNEELELAHPDVQAFLDAAKQALTSSDNETIRNELNVLDNLMVGEDDIL
jgi:hypothetical protein